MVEDILKFNEFLKIGFRKSPKIVEVDKEDRREKIEGYPGDPTINRSSENWRKVSKEGEIIK